MKKILALIIAVLCIFGTFSVSAAKFERTSDDGIALPVTVEFSDDYSKLIYEGVTYTQFNDELITGNLETTNSSVKLTPAQQEKFSSVKVDISHENDIIYAYYNLKNGGQITFSYLKDEYIQSYNDAMMNNWESARIDFTWPEGNVITAKREALKQTKNNLFMGDYTDYFDVYVPIGGKDFGINKGLLYIEGDEYYYIDFADAGIVYDGSFDISEHSNLSAYKITDESLCGEIKAAIEKNYGEELGFFDDDNFTEKVSDAFLVIIFAIIPFAIFLLFLILALRSKTRYKKFFACISVLSAAELIIFIVLEVLFTVLKA